MGAVLEVTIGGGVRRVFGVAVALAAVALGGAGCQSLSKTRADMMRSVGLSKPTPPAQFICMVQSGLQDLPDTTRGGQPTKAILGKMFLFGQDQKPVEAAGQLTLMMTDATPRPAGAAELTPVVTVIDQATLKKLRAAEERFGQCYAFVIPWPTDWVDVTQITIQATFKPDPAFNLPTMHHQPMRMSLKENMVVLDQKTGLPVGGSAAGGPALGGVPDPDMLLKQFQAGGFKPEAVPGSPLRQASGTTPPTTTAGPNGSVVTTQAWVAPPPQQPQPAGGFGLPNMPTTPPLETPGPQPVMPPPLGNFPGVSGTAPVMPDTIPGMQGGSFPGLSNMPGVPAGGGYTATQVWPARDGMPPPAVGPIGELRPDGALQPVVIPRR